MKKIIKTSRWVTLGIIADGVTLVGRTKTRSLKKLVAYIRPEKPIITCIFRARGGASPIFYVALVQLAE